MNQFYTLPEYVSSTHIILTGQEAKHAAKVLRKGIGDSIYITDGAGTRYTGEVEHIGKNELRASIKNKRHFSKPPTTIELCLGLIRKRDRLEFAVEKATELGVSKISLFKADHTEPFKVRTDRVEAAVLSAMKQSLRVFLPQVYIYNSLDELLERDLKKTLILQADMDGQKSETVKTYEEEELLMVVGPEGGLSDREQELLKQNNAQGVSLGDFRLRAETAAMMMSAIFGNKKADLS
jgi:16S rRNA (uracil1498-N3)-methyltransferase